MAEYPARLEQEHLLAGGRRVAVRPIRPQDQAGEWRFFDQLSGETRRRRFMKFASALNQDLMRFFTHIDYQRHMAFVCEHDGRLVGEARYVANPGGRSCEFGVVVADDWHHTGVAQLLMHALMDAARAQGFDTMGGLVLRDNQPMLDFVRELGFETAPEPYERTLVRVIKRL